MAAAYAAVVSLKHTANSLLHSSLFSFIPDVEEVLLNAVDCCTEVQRFLEISNDNRLVVLKEQIRDAAYKLEDAIELYESNLLSSELENREYEGVGYKIRAVIPVFGCFLELSHELSNGVLNPVHEEDDDDGGNNDGDYGDDVEMVGHSIEFAKVRDHLLQRLRPVDLCFFRIVGEAGSGRSAIAETYFEGEKGRFECCAWLTIGRHYSIKEIALLLLYQVGNDEVAAAAGLSEEDEEMVCKYLYKALENRRYMIVLDDVHDEGVLDRLRSSFPDQSNGSLVLLTTSQEEMFGSLQRLHTLIGRGSYFFDTMGSYRLIRSAIGIENMFNITEGIVQAGEEIHANCGRRRLALAKTLLYLNKIDKTEEEWRKLAADKGNPVFKVEDEISEVRRIKTDMQSHNCDDRIVGTIEILIDFSYDVLLFETTIQPRRFFSKMEIISLWGMAGIGKTTYAKMIIQDESILSNYDHCVWVTLGPKYQAEEILIDILAQMYQGTDKMRLKGDDNFVRKLCVLLSSKRCFIVLDNLWSKEPLEHLKRLFPDIKGRVLLTTRLKEVTEWGQNDTKFKVRFLDEEESWTLLRQKVFAEGSCPPELEKAGRTIAEKCDSLPLLLHKVADQLLKVEQNSKYSEWSTIKIWKHVASGKKNPVFTKAHDEISKALRPSYMILPQHLKALLLYMGIFCERDDISVSKLCGILFAEGFIQYPIAKCLTELEGKSVVMARYEYYMESCRLHSVFWHLCNTEAVKNKFFCALDGYDDCSIENLQSQRRLCIRASTLLGIKDVQESMAASAKSAHSLLCVGPPHQYQVPICFGMRMLRVMDALAIRQYEFPDDVVKLLHLRYLALTYWGELPPLISKLWKLQFLIVNRYVNTKSSKNSSLLPKGIWDMKELRHLQIMGGRLPNPEGGAGLPNLIALLDVSAQSCTREVLGMIPKLKMLGVRIELAPNDEANSFDCLNNIYMVCGLESLTCVVVNPQFRHKVIDAPPPAPVSMFPSSLQRLTLSGFGYPWEYMSIIGKLKNLETLELKSYAFRGPMWLMDSDGFKKLKCLLIEDTDLVHWETRSPRMIEFNYVRIKHCYKLRILPLLLTMLQLDIVDCNPLAVTSAELLRHKAIPFELRTQSTWIDPKVHVTGLREGI